MQKQLDLTEALRNTWKTSNQTTTYLFKNIPAGLWNEKIPGYSRKTIASIAIHLHNVRCSWIKSLTAKKTANALLRIDPGRGTRKELIANLNHSNKAMLKLLADCVDNGGRLPSQPAWLNFPNDVMHLLTYMIAHEAHHRGQIIMAARQLGQPFNTEIIGGVWQWKKRLKESQ